MMIKLNKCHLLYPNFQKIEIKDIKKVKNSRLHRDSKYENKKTKCNKRQETTTTTADTLELKNIEKIINGQDNLTTIELESIKLLEWDKICSQLSCFCNTPMALERVMAQEMPMAKSIEENEILLNQTEEAIKANLKFEKIYDISPIFEIKKEIVFTPFQIIGILITIESCIKIIQEIRPEFKYLNEIIHKIKDLDILKEITKQIRLCIRVLDGFIVDEASEKLSEIRKDKNENNKKLDTELNNYAQLYYKEGICERPVVVYRRERACLAVKAGKHTQLPKGSVKIEESSSGYTYYMELKSVIELNNKNTMYITNERIEEQIILLKLTNEILSNKDKIKEIFEVIIEMDLINAKARYSLWLNGIRPKFINKNYKMLLPNVTHPILLEAVLDELPLAPLIADETFENDFKSMISIIGNTVKIKKEYLVKDPKPFDIKIENKYSVVAITGANTGGKTVALKTIGLSILMAKSGIYIPAKEGDGIEECKIRWFSSILVDIGDGQSLEKEMSTFGSHINKINQILEVINEESLILLDEIGTGTDPDQGSALASAILLKFAELGSLTVVTTHYDDIKRLADEREDFINACVEFDLKTLKPTYKLLWNQSGDSNAIDIAESLGFDKEIIKEARELLKKITEMGDNREYLFLDGLNKQLEEMKEKLNKNNEKNEKKKKELEYYKNIIKDLELNKNNNVKLKEFEDELDNEIEWIVSEAKAGNLTREEAEMCLKELRERGPRLKDISENCKNLEWIPKKGDYVKLLEVQNKIGIVTAVKSNFKITVKVDKLIVEAKIWEIEKAEKIEEKYKKSKKIDLKSILKIKEEAIDIRGESCDDGIRIVEMTLNQMAKGGKLRIMHGYGTGKLKSAILNLLSKNKKILKYEESLEGYTTAYLR